LAGRDETNVCDRRAELQCAADGVCHQRSKTARAGPASGRNKHDDQEIKDD
jgi:hypothetical protein